MYQPPPAPHYAPRSGVPVWVWLLLLVGAVGACLLPLGLVGFYWLAQSRPQSAAPPAPVTSPAPPTAPRPAPAPLAPG